jgi:hypothetical protein
MFAEVVIAGGSGLIHGLLMLLLIGICVGLIYWAGTWFFTKCGAPPMALTVWTGLFILVGLIIIINFIMGLGGHSFIAW